MASRVDQLQASVKAGLDTARGQAQTAVLRSVAGVRQDMADGLQAIQSRIGDVETSQREGRDLSAQFRQEIDGLRAEVAGARRDAANASEQIKQMQETQRTQEAQRLRDVQKPAVVEQAVVERKSASAPATQTASSADAERKTVRFQVSGRRKHQIAPGIQLELESTDPPKQQIEGALILEADSSVVPIHAQPVKHPITFDTGDPTKPFELMFTEIGKNQVTGVLLMPSSSATTAKRRNPGTSRQ